jgi:hypothetical protein
MTLPEREPDTEYGAQHRPIAELPTDILRAKIGWQSPVLGASLPRERHPPNTGSDTQIRASQPVAAGSYASCPSSV